MASQNLLPLGNVVDRSPALSRLPLSRSGNADSRSQQDDDVIDLTASEQVEDAEVVAVEEEHRDEDARAMFEGVQLKHLLLGDRLGARRDGGGGYQGCNSRVFRIGLRGQRPQQAGTDRVEPGEDSGFSGSADVCRSVRSRVTMSPSGTTRGAGTTDALAARAHREVAVTTSPLKGVSASSIERPGLSKRETTTMAAAAAAAVAAGAKADAAIQPPLLPSSPCAVKGAIKLGKELIRGSFGACFDGSYALPMDDRTRNKDTEEGIGVGKGVGKEVGGGQGEVVEVVGGGRGDRKTRIRNEQKEEFALKMALTYRGQDPAQVEREMATEIAVLVGGRISPHANIIRGLHSFQDNVGKDLEPLLWDGLGPEAADVLSPWTSFVIMPLCTAGSLQALLNKRRMRCNGPPFLRLMDAMRFLEQMLSAVEHLLAHGLAHNDIKPDNWLLRGDQRSLILTDFGACVDSARPPSTPPKAPAESGPIMVDASPPAMPGPGTPMNVVAIASSAASSAASSSLAGRDAVAVDVNHSFSSATRSCEGIDGDTTVHLSAACSSDTRTAPAQKTVTALGVSGDAQGKKRSRQALEEMETIPPSVGAALADADAAGPVAATGVSASTPSQGVEALASSNCPPNGNEGAECVIGDGGKDKEQDSVAIHRERGKRRRYSSSDNFAGGSPISHAANCRQNVDSHRSPMMRTPRGCDGVEGAAAVWSRARRKDGASEELVFPFSDYFVAGTPKYVAPELAKAWQERTVLDFRRSDVFSVGVCLYHMLRPGGAGDIMDLEVREAGHKDADLGAENDWPLPLFPENKGGCCFEVSQLCRGLVQADPSQRHTASEGRSLAAWFVSRLGRAGGTREKQGSPIPVAAAAPSCAIDVDVMSTIDQSALKKSSSSGVEQISPPFHDSNAVTATSIGSEALQALATSASMAGFARGGIAGYRPSSPSRMNDSARTTATGSGAAPGAAMAERKYCLDGGVRMPSVGARTGRNIDRKYGEGADGRERETSQFQDETSLQETSSQQCAELTAATKASKMLSVKEEEDRLAQPDELVRSDRISHMRDFFVSAAPEDLFRALDFRKWDVNGACAAFDDVGHGNGGSNNSGSNNSNSNSNINGNGDSQHKNGSQHVFSKSPQGPQRIDDNDDEWAWAGGKAMSPEAAAVPTHPAVMTPSAMWGSDRQRHGHPGANAAVFQQWRQTRPSRSDRERPVGREQHGTPSMDKGQGSNVRAAGLTPESNPRIWFEEAFEDLKTRYKEAFPPPCRL